MFEEGQVRQCRTDCCGRLWSSYRLTDRNIVIENGRSDFLKAKRKRKRKEWHRDGRMEPSSKFEVASAAILNGRQER